MLRCEATPGTGELPAAYEHYDFMTRYIRCLKCFSRGLHSDDKFRWKMRFKFVSLVNETPPDHGITMNGNFGHLPDFLCDSCSEVIKGTAAAVTVWRAEDEEPGDWESRYGVILPPEAVDLERALTKGV